MTSSLIQTMVSRHEKILEQLVEQTDIPAERIKKAIIYSLFPGGKRLRPVLVYLCGQLINVPPENLDAIAAAIELTHAYSLIHDDLPAMDNDDMRRGKPSCHRAFDEATAILAGDALQIMAIDVLLAQLPKSHSPAQVLAITQALIHASGPSGMISGQSLDLTELSKPETTEAQCRSIHALKTGKLISACIQMVLLAGNPSSEETQALQHFASHLGLVFQMQDDHLDAFDRSGRFGKGRSSDKANQKITFATLYPEVQLAQMINEHYKSALNELISLGPIAKELSAFIVKLHQRTALHVY